MQHLHATAAQFMQLSSEEDSVYNLSNELAATGETAGMWISLTACNTQARSQDFLKGSYIDV